MKLVQRGKVVQVMLLKLMNKYALLLTHEERAALAELATWIGEASKRLDDYAEVDPYGES